MPEIYGEDDYGQETYSGDLDDIVTDRLIEYFPFILPRETDSVFRRYIESYDDQFIGIDEGMRYVELSRFVDEAEGDDLNHIGEMFGALGARGDRNDTEYRTYLQSIVNSFSGRGTVPGLKFAISASVNATTDDIIITEDFENNEYTIEVNNVDSDFLSGVINNLAELADPSAIELAEAPILITGGDELLIDKQASQEVSSASGLGSGTLTLDGNSQLQ